jgi:hypothetical protein
MGGKVKKLGGARKEVPLVKPTVVLTLEAKKEIGRSILRGEVSVKKAQEAYNATPQAVGWWKRLAEKEEAVDIGMKDAGYEVLLSEMEEADDDPAPEGDDNTMDLHITGLVEVQIRDCYGKVILSLPGKDLRILRDFRNNTASWKGDE